MTDFMNPFGYLTKLFNPNNMPSSFENLFNPDEYYNLFREDINKCCELAFRYNLVTGEENGLLQGGRIIFESSTLNELRIAKLLEGYFGKNCLIWDPASSTGKKGEFLLSTCKPNIFIEVKTIEKQNFTDTGILISNENSIENALRKAYEKIREGIDIPFLVILCHDHYDVEISDFQIIRACFGRIAYQDGMPEVIARGFCSPDIHHKLSAIGLYYYNYSIELPEFFEIYHNDNAKKQIDYSIFENKADKQWQISNWNGRLN